MSHEEKANKVLEQAKAIGETASSWTAFSAEVFGQHRGIIAEAFSPGLERQWFYDSNQYKQIQAILIALMKKFGVAAGSRVGDEIGQAASSIPTIHQKMEIGPKLEGIA